MGSISNQRFDLMASEMKNHYMNQSNDSIFDILIAMKKCCSHLLLTSLKYSVTLCWKITKQFIIEKRKNKSLSEIEKKLTPEITKY